MSHRRTYVHLLAVAMVLGMLLAACGGKDENTGGGDQTTSATAGAGSIVTSVSTNQPSAAATGAPAHTPTRIIETPTVTAAVEPTDTTAPEPTPTDTPPQATKLTP